MLSTFSQTYSYTLPTHRSFVQMNIQERKMQLFKRVENSVANGEITSPSITMFSNVICC